MGFNFPIPSLSYTEYGTPKSNNVLRMVWSLMTMEIVEHLGPSYLAGIIMR